MKKSIALLCIIAFYDSLVVYVTAFCHGGANGSVSLKRRAIQSSSRRHLPHHLYASSNDVVTSLPEVTALPPHTFAGQVEHAMIERFGHGDENSIFRVLQSWRFLEINYEHREYHGSHDNPEQSLCHQHCHTYVPGLTVKEFWNTQSFDWTQTLASKYKAIRKEFLDVTADVAQLQEQGNNIWAGALSEDASSYGLGWKTLVLMDRGRWDPINVNLFPVTAQAVHDAGVPAVEVFFASLQPNSNIKPHSDFTNFVLTSHLGVDIPYSGENKCRLQIGDTTRQWINGEVMVFDTSLMHDAVNESDKTRYILMMRIWHPELTPIERKALQFIYDCLDFPNLLSTDENLRRQAEQQVEQSRVFPEIKRGGRGPNKGFGSSGGSRSAKNKKRSSKPTGFAA
jgi:aspartate beta-hydroxylase